MSSRDEILGVKLEDTNFQIQNGELTVAGRRLSEFAAASDGAPVYVYDGGAIQARLLRLRQALGPEIGIKYAVKANPNPDVLAFLAPRVNGFDVASAAELQAVLGLVEDASTISLAGPGKSDGLMREAISSGVTICVESSRELMRLSALGDALGVRPKLLIRVNPDFTLRGSGMRMSGAASQFGVDQEDAGELLRRLPENVECYGLHVFCGSQCLSTEALIEAHTQVFRLADELAGSAGLSLRALNVGAGFGVPYFAGDAPIDLDAVAYNLKMLTAGLERAHPALAVEIELGRYLVAEAGVYLCTVVDRKRSRGEVFLITNGGMNHHLAASGNLGQLVKRNYPLCIANRMGDVDQETANVVGNLCTPLDVLARGARLAVADVGDTVAIFQSGAYGLSASPIGFLGHPAPGEVFIPA